ncbi:hypothetical protein FOL47_002823 [Perkinsus chesapeaki]|uniref:Uncharacterized protein n=1 Tax=Perkinsus chesapeaki TaxID=330153 RepID=A0A7J6MC13_PERCH|nr:hypothetical protein FOL47_002823 [Perkinsus chesapeaki]
MYVPRERSASAKCRVMGQVALADPGRPTISRNDELIADMVKHWMNAKARRKRPKGIKRFAQGSVKICPSVDESPELEVDIQQDDVGGDGPGRLRRKAYTKALARFTELVDDEDEDEGS